MNQIESLIFLLAAAAVLTPLAGTLKIPYPVVLVVGGIVIGFIPGLPDVEVAAEVIFLVFLPPLLNASAFSSSPLDMRDHLRSISFLAIVLVVITAGAVALVAHYAVGLPWAVSFVLGGILAPTDPVAAEAVFKRLGVPRRVGTIVGGESLVNDGSGLAIYQVALTAAVTGAFSVWEAGGSFVLLGGGGILLGVAIASFVSPLISKIRDPAVAITLSLLIPYGIYVLADSLLQVSGILAVVAYGLYQSRRSPLLFRDASTRLRAASFWETLVFILETLLFVLLGQQLRVILGGIEEYSLAQVALFALAVYGVLLATRFGWFFTIPYLQPYLDRFFRDSHLLAPWRERLVMSWSGMRGAVSLAAALAIPLTVESGGDFPRRDLVLAIAFAVIVATLVLQGLTLGTIIAALGLQNEETTISELEARLTAARAALDRLEELGESSTVPLASRDRMRRNYEERVRRYNSGLEAGGMTEDYSDQSHAWRDLRRELLDAERSELVDARDRGDIPAEVMRDIQRDLDLEESRLED